MLQNYMECQNIIKIMFICNFRSSRNLLKAFQSVRRWSCALHIIVIKKWSHLLMGTWLRWWWGIKMVVVNYDSGGDDDDDDGEHDDSGGDCDGQAFKGFAAQCLLSLRSDGWSDGESDSESDGESDGPGPPVQPSFLEPQCPLTGTKKKISRSPRHTTVENRRNPAERISISHCIKFKTNTHATTFKQITKLKSELIQNEQTVRVHLKNNFLHYSV